MPLAPCIVRSAASWSSPARRLLSSRETNTAQTVLPTGLMGGVAGSRQVDVKVVVAQPARLIASSASVVTRKVTLDMGRFLLGAKRTPELCLTPFTDSSR